MQMLQRVQCKVVQLWSFHHLRKHVHVICNHLRIDQWRNRQQNNRKVFNMKTVKQWYSGAQGGKEEDLDEIEVFPHTCKPTLAWAELRAESRQIVRSIHTIPTKTPITEDSVRFVCVSDTHNRTERLQVPPGDVLLHAGDFTMTGQMSEVEHFNSWLGSLPHKYKVVIAGNHDLSFDDEILKDYFIKHRFMLDVEEVRTYLKDKGVERVSDLLTDCIYLQDAGVQLYGINIYGSPWQPEFGGWGFNLERGQPCLDKWNMIPKNTDVLMTHGPPIGHGDLCNSDLRAGCVELLTTIQRRVKPRYHVFGHIHEGYGITTDGTTKFINASSCSINYKPTQRPIVFDIKLPKGMTKNDFVNQVVTIVPGKEMSDSHADELQENLKMCEDVVSSCIESDAQRDKLQAEDESQAGSSRSDHQVEGMVDVMSCDVD